MACKGCQKRNEQYSEFSHNNQRIQRVSLRELFCIIFSRILPVYNIYERKAEMARRKASSLTLITLTRGLQLLQSVINGRHGSTAAFLDKRDLECMMDTNSNGITMIEFGAYYL